MKTKFPSFKKVQSCLNKTYKNYDSRMQDVVISVYYIIKALTLFPCNKSTKGNKA